MSSQQGEIVAATTQVGQVLGLRAMVNIEHHHARNFQCSVNFIKKWWIHASLFTEISTLWYKNRKTLNITRCMAKPAWARRPAHSITNAKQALGICVDHRRHLANMIKPKCVANVSLQLVLRANFRGWANTRQLRFGVSCAWFLRRWMTAGDRCLVSNAVMPTGGPDGQYPLSRGLWVRRPSCENVDFYSVIELFASCKAHKDPLFLRRDVYTKYYKRNNRYKQYNTW